MLASGEASAQDSLRSILVYSLGGDGSAQENAQARAIVRDALNAEGRTIRIGDPGCDPDAACFSEVLSEAQSTAAAVVTYWTTGEIRTTPNLVITLADRDGLVAAASDVPDAAAMPALAAQLLERIVFDWPRRAGVTLFLDTDPSGAPVRIDGIFAQSPVVRPLELGDHEIFAGTNPPVRRELVVNGESDEEIHLVIPLEGQTVVGGNGHGSNGDGNNGHGNNDPAASSDESSWPSYALGGGLLAAGAALWIGPAITLANKGECADRCAESNPERYAMDGGQVALAITGSVLAAAGVVFLAARPIRVGASATPSSAALTLEGQF